MRWYRLVILGLIGLIVLWMINIQIKIDYSDPKSEQNNFYQKLDHALSLSKIETLSYDYRDFADEVEFKMKTENGLARVIVSTKKDPYLQVASLQKVTKEATIKGKEIRLIDLSIRHPYATLQNN